VKAAKLSSARGVSEKETKRDMKDVIDWKFKKAAEKSASMSSGGDQEDCDDCDNSKTYEKTSESSESSCHSHGYEMLLTTKKKFDAFGLNFIK